MPLDETLAEVLTSAVTTAEEAKSFVLAELPDVVTQLLMWEMVYNLLFFSIGVLLTVISILPAWAAVRTFDFKSDNEFEIVSDSVIFLFSISCMGVFLGLYVTLASLTWLQILIAPKVYLLEYAAQLVK